jgi:hypothetical protein
MKKINITIKISCIRYYSITWTLISKLEIKEIKNKRNMCNKEKEKIREENKGKNIEKCYHEK